MDSEFWILNSEILLYALPRRRQFVLDEPLSGTR
jgi:hypothetical protein